MKGAISLKSLGAQDEMSTFLRKSPRGTFQILITSQKLREER